MRSFVQQEAREARQAFVTGHAGSTLLETTVLIMTAPLLLLAHAKVTSKSRAFNDILFVALPLLFAYTVAPDAISVYAIPVLCAVSMFVLESPAPLGAEREPDRAVTTLRGIVVLSTVICILAVDFTIFPRRFAKTEWTGTGLMDIGVGAFCFTGAIVPRRRAWSVGRTLTAIVPLYVLGMARFAAIKLSNYQEHVSEYGVHWNFFFTLIVVRVALDIVTALAPQGRVVVGCAVLTAYQAALSLTPLGAWIMDDGPREHTRMVWQNKEGLASAVGYAGLSMLANGVAASRPVPSTRDYAAACAVAWAALLCCVYGLQLPVSRRQCNLSFVLWIYAEGATMLLMAHAGLDSASTLMRALSVRQLAVFLGANVLTGAVNMAMETMAAPPATALAVLSLYVVAVCGFALRV